MARKGERRLDHKQRAKESADPRSAIHFDIVLEEPRLSVSLRGVGDQDRATLELAQHQPGARSEMRRPCRRREAMLLETGCGARRYQARALRDDNQLIAGDGMTGTGLAGRHVRDDEAPHRHEGQATVNLDDAHVSARVGMLLDVHEFQAAAGHVSQMLPANSIRHSAIGAGKSLHHVLQEATATRRWPHAVFALSRSLNFWILPVEVLGSSVNTTRLGHLKRASFFLQ